MDNQGTPQQPPQPPAAEQPPQPPLPTRPVTPVYTEEQLKVRISEAMADATKKIDGLSTKILEMQTRERTSTIIAALAQAGAGQYADLLADKVAVDTRDPKALKAAVDDLKKTYPTLFHPGPGDGGTGSGAQPGNDIGDDMNARIRLAAGRAPH